MTIKNPIFFPRKQLSTEKEVVIDTFREANLKISKSTKITDQGLSVQKPHINNLQEIVRLFSEEINNIPKQYIANVRYRGQSLIMTSYSVIFEINIYSSVSNLLCNFILTRLMDTISWYNIFYQLTQIKISWEIYLIIVYLV